MNAIQFVSIIRHGLPGCHFEQIKLRRLVARVRWAGQQFDISGGMLDGFPLWLVTTPCYTLNDATGKVLTMLDSMSDEWTREQRPWADVDEMIKRLRELGEEAEGEDYDPA